MKSPFTAWWRSLLVSGKSFKRHACCHFSPWSGESEASDSLICPASVWNYSNIRLSVNPKEGMDVDACECCRKLTDEALRYAEPELHVRLRDCATCANSGFCFILFYFWPCMAEAATHSMPAAHPCLTSLKKKKKSQYIYHSPSLAFTPVVLGCLYSIRGMFSTALLLYCPRFFAQQK